MKFFMAMIPPTITDQEKKITVRNGKPLVYKPAELKEAKEKLKSHLMQHVPATPFKGPLWLSVMWLWKSTEHKEGEFKMTKPDTDNLEKLLKDCMTECGFWRDDAQVAVEHIEKRWTREIPGISILVEQL